MRDLDFGLKDELMKPWIAVGRYWHRMRYIPGSKLFSSLRFMICFPISLCVLLQGLGVNTIGIPKQRWYPNYFSDGVEFPAVPTGDAVIETPKLEITGATWDGLWAEANEMFGEAFLPTGQIVAALSASQTFIGLGQL